jgi:hypothetical protein
MAATNSIRTPWSLDRLSMTSGIINQAPTAASGAKQVVDELYL